MAINNLRVAIIAVDGFEESELIEPRKALLEAGAKVDVISARPAKSRASSISKRPARVKVDRTSDEARPDEYDGSCFRAAR